MLDAKDLLRRAEAETGLRDFGDDTLPERFGLAVDHLNSVGLDAAGERAAEGVCHWLLTSRLQVFEDFKRQLAELPGRVGRNVLRGAVNAGASVIRKEAVLRAPQYTGSVQAGHPPPGTQTS